MLTQLLARVIPTLAKSWQGYSPTFAVEPSALLAKRLPASSLPEVLSFDVVAGVTFRSSGVPLSLYSDRHTIFHSPRQPSVIEQLANRKPLTQFGRAMEELGVSIIKAYSPQAKGRIERQWGVFQDRLVVELRLAGARTIEDANRVLDAFLPGYNRNFRVAPREQTAVWRKPPSAYQLDRILCLKESRVVGRDHVVSFDGLALQLTSEKKYFSLAGQRVEVLQLKDGSVEVHHERRMVTRFTATAIARLIRQGARAKKQVA